MKKLFLIFLILTPIIVSAQLGGSRTYEFLNIPVSARVGAMGGSVVSVYDDDVNLGLENPSLYQQTMDKNLSLTYLNYFSDINYGYVSYTKDFKKIGTFSSGIKYINYGKFKETDEGGNELGTFTAGEYAFVLGWGKQIDSSFYLGANLKPIYSNLYEYNSFGLLTDVAVTYYNKENEFSTAIVIKNLGTQIKPYVEGNKEKVPFEVQAGLSKKLKHVPLRMSLTLVNLQQWDLTYNDSININTGLIVPEQEEDDIITKTENDFFDKAMRHAVFGVEFIPSKNFNIRLGYNYKRRQELALANKPGMVGFSWGLGFRVKKIHISYGSARYHLAGSTNHFTISTNLGELYSKSNEPSVKKKKKKNREKKD